MMKARKGGFTLVELLIVIMIIAILAGMVMLATGSATDGAEATKVANDLRNLKGAALMFFVDENRWPNAATDATSLDVYMDRSFLNGTQYDGLKISSFTDANGIERALIGLGLNTDTTETHRPSVRKKLANNAASAGLMNNAGANYSDEEEIYIAMN